MRTGEVEANLVHLNETFHLPYISDLIHRKTSGAEKMALNAGELAFHREEFTRLQSQLESASQSTSLPDVPSARAALDALLVRLRLANLPSSRQNP
jgi:hypothetical protein